VASCHIQATGEDYSVEPAESRRPFRALLDVGLVKTTTGNRVFGALKVFYLMLRIVITDIFYSVDIDGA
jgi:large subunit ribosomal protein L5e